MKAHAVALALALAAGGLAACHGGPVHHPGEEFIQAIRFEGNHAIDSDTLRSGLALEEVRGHGGAPDPYLVTQDRERVRGIYVRRGYFEVDIHSRVERHGEAVTVVYKVDEGRRAVTKVEITGLPEDPELPLSRVRKRLPLHDGEPFSYDAYDHAKGQLLQVVEDAGYAHAHLDARVLVDRTRNEAIVQLHYTPGVKCRFGEITITGAPPVLEEAVRARLAIHPGEQFTTRDITKSQRAIYRMKRFSAVRVVPQLGGDGPMVPIQITLGQAARHELALGGGFGLDPATYEVRGRADYQISSWPFPLDDLELDARPAYAFLRDGSGYEPRIRALARLTRMDFLHPFVTGTVETGYDYLVWEAYTSYGPHVRLGLESPLGFDELRLRVGWMLENYQFAHLSPLVDPTTAHELGLDTNERVGQLEQTLRLDLRDNPIEPHEGVWAQVQVSEGSPYFAGAYSYTQITPELRVYVPVGPDVVLAARSRAGTFIGDIPTTERYFSGGPTTQRGFSERMLAPTLFGMVGGSERSVPIGGGGLFESNVEVRTELGKVHGMGLGGVVFLDGADVRERFSDIDFGNLHWAAGAGLRLFTIVGAIRVDFGYRLNRTGPMEPEPNSHYAFHLSLGEAF